MADGKVSSRGEVALTKNPPAIEIEGLPTVSGLSAKATLDRDGNVRVTVSAFATYADREVSVIEEIPLEDTNLDEALKALIADNQNRIGQKAYRAATQAWEIAVRRGEL